MEKAAAPAAGAKAAAPAVGNLVHYVMSDLSCRAALVTGVDEAGAVNLHVFRDGPNDLPPYQPGFINAGPVLPPPLVYHRSAVSTATDAPPPDVIAPPAWAATTLYAVNDQILEAGIIYTATVPGTSGTTLPALPTTIGATVTEGPDTPPLTWQATSHSPIAAGAAETAAPPAPALPDWAASTAYALNAQILHAGIMYTATVPGTSGDMPPTLPTTMDETVTDGTDVPPLTWKATATAGANAPSKPTPEQAAAAKEQAALAAANAQAALVDTWHLVDDHAAIVERAQRAKKSAAKAAA